MAETPASSGARSARGDVDTEHGAACAGFEGASVRGAPGGMVGDPRSSEALWTLVNFTDDRYYPADALLRHEAMAALLRIALATHRPPPGPKKTMVLSPPRPATTG